MIDERKDHYVEFQERKKTTSRKTTKKMGQRARCMMHHRPPVFTLGINSHIPKLQRNNDTNVTNYLNKVDKENRSVIRLGHYITKKL